MRSSDIHPTPDEDLSDVVAEAGTGAGPLAAGPLRVLVVGIYFGPDDTGIAPYTTQLCEYLVANGASVSVFAGVPHYPGWSVAPGYRRCLRRVERRERFEVRRLRHCVPRRQSALHRATYELSFAAQVALQRPSERPDVVLAVVPSLLSAVVARRVAARAGAPLVVWVQDLMGPAAAQSGIEGGSRVAGVVGAIERRLLRGADRVLVLNQHFADHVRSIGVDADRVSIRPNWVHVPGRTGTDRRQVRSRLGWRDETVVLHSGNMGLKQDLGNVIAAGGLAARRDDPKLRFVLMGDGSQRAALQQQASGVRTVEFLPPVPAHEYVDVLAAADILVVNERRTAVDMSLPSKLTSYLHAGRPIVAAAPAHGGTAAEVRRSGGGLITEPGRPAALLATIERLADDPQLADALIRCGRSYAAEALDARPALRELLATLVSVARPPRPGPHQLADPAPAAPAGSDP